MHGPQGERGHFMGAITREFGRRRALYLMAAPGLGLLFIFSYMPMVGIVVAFKDYTIAGGIFGSPWVGFGNFRFFFISGKALLVTRNTVLYNTAFIVVNTVLNLLVAIVLSEIRSKHFKKVSQTLLLMPYFVSWVVVNAMLYNMLNYEFGQVRGLFDLLALPPVDVYGTPSAWKYIIVILNAWKEVGYGSIVYLAAIMSIDREIYEASDIDGASIFHQIRYITLPCLKPTVIILVLLAIGSIFRGNFGMFYQIVNNNGTLFNATDVIDTFVFRSLIQTKEYGMSAAAGLYQSVLCFAILMLSNYVVKRVDPDYSLF